MPTAEAVYGYFYVQTPEKTALLMKFDLNYYKLYDRLCKVIPCEKIRSLNELAHENYELGEA